MPVRVKSPPEAINRFSFPKGSPALIDFTIRKSWETEVWAPKKQKTAAGHRTHQARGV